MKITPQDRLNLSLINALTICAECLPEQIREASENGYSFATDFVEWPEIVKPACEKLNTAGYTGRAIDRKMFLTIGEFKTTFNIENSPALLADLKKIMNEGKPKKISYSIPAPQYSKKKARQVAESLNSEAEALQEINRVKINVEQARKDVASSAKLASRAPGEKLISCFETELEFWELVYKEAQTLDFEAIRDEREADKCEAVSNWFGEHDQKMQDEYGFYLFPTDIWKRFKKANITPVNNTEVILQLYLAELMNEAGQNFEQYGQELIDGIEQSQTKVKAEYNGKGRLKNNSHRNRDSVHRLERNIERDERILKFLYQNEAEINDLVNRHNYVNA